MKKISFKNSKIAEKFTLGLNDGKRPSKRMSNMLKNAGFRWHNEEIFMFISLLPQKESKIIK
jgi:hypothetical protein